MLKSFLLAALLATSGFAATADSSTEFTVDGIKYNVTDSTARTVEVIANNYQYDITIPETVTPDTITWTVTAVGKEAFKGSKVTHVDLPNTVTHIKEKAFYESALISINLSNTLDSMDNHAFFCCKNLTEIELPQSLIKLGSHVFDGSNITTIVIPDKVTCIPSFAFEDCQALTTVKLPQSVIEIQDAAFLNCSSLNYIEMPGVRSIGNSAFSGCKMQKIALPQSLTELGENAFNSCDELTEIYLPDNITRINEDTFSKCSKLKRIKLPKNLIYIGPGAFSKSGITEIALPERTDELYSHFGIFSKTPLRNVFIPESVKRISSFVFTECYSLQGFHVRHKNPININQVFDATSYTGKTDISKCTLYVPKGCTEAYMAADVWKEFGAIVEEGLSINLEPNKTMIAGTSSEITKATTPCVFPETSIEWSSSNLGVATVDAYGKVTAISEGTAIITAKMTLTEGFEQEEASSSCTLTVKGEPTDYFSTGNATMFTNSQLYLPISLTNEKSITAFQCDIYMPNGVELITVEDEYDFTFAGRESRTHSISSELQPDGAVRVVAFSSKNTPFESNNGELFNLPIQSTSSTGEYNIEIKNIILVDNTNTEQATVDVDFWVTVKDYLPGDANIDNRVTISDATTTVSYILGENPEPFMLAAADVTKDDNVTINDVTGIIDIVLGTVSKSVAAYTKTESNSAAENDRLYIENFTIEGGETKDIEICLANSKSYTAFQCDIFLSAGLNFLVEDEEYIVDLSNRKARSHTIATSMQPDGALRVVAFSSKNADFSGNDGALMILPLIANETLPVEAELSIKNSLFVSDGVEYTLPDITVHSGNTSSIDSVVDNHKSDVYAKGNILHIISPENKTMRMYSMDGRYRDLSIESGHNTFTINKNGIYIINQKKIVIH